MAHRVELRDYVAVLALLVTGAIVLGRYSGLDSVGWISHREDSVITAKENWFVGESKDCTSVPLDVESAGALKKPEGYAIRQINCDDGPEHSVPITFWGRTEQPEYKWVTWRCTRDSDSFTCKQTGASNPTLPPIKGTDNSTGRPIISHDGGKTWQWADQ